MAWQLVWLTVFKTSRGICISLQVIQNYFWFCHVAVAHHFTWDTLTAPLGCAGVKQGSQYCPDVHPAIPGILSTSSFAEHQHLAFTLLSFMQESLLGWRILGGTTRHGCSVPGVVPQPVKNGLAASLWDWCLQQMEMVVLELWIGTFSIPGTRACRMATSLLLKCLVLKSRLRIVFICGTWPKPGICQEPWWDNQD